MTAHMRAEIKQEKVHGFTVDALRSETDVAIAVLDILNIGDDKNIVVNEDQQGHATPATAVLHHNHRHNPRAKILAGLCVHMRNLSGNIGSVLAQLSLN